MSSPAASDLQQRAQKLAADRERARKDKLFLANEVLGYCFQQDVHGELFEQYISMDASKPLLLLDETKDRLILWPRGHYKSTSVTVEIIQLILNYPDIRICIMRSTLKLSREWLNEISSHFTGEAPGSRLRELFPDFCGTRKDLKLTSDKFITPSRKQRQLRQPTVFVASFTSDTTGVHYDVGFFDDLVTKDNYRNPDRLKKVIDGFWAITPQVDPGGYRYVTGTRYAFGDLYEDIIRKNTNGNWVVSVKDCWTDDGQGVRFPQRQLPDGKVIGFTKEGLLQIMQDDPAMFASQYLNRPAIEGTQTFTESMLSGALVDPNAEIELFQPVIMVDIASGGGPRTDDAVVMCGMRDAQGNTYIVDGEGGQWTPTLLAKQVIAMTLKHRPLKVLTETSPATAHFRDVLERECRDQGVRVPFDILKGNNTKDAKKQRIWNLVSYLQRSRLKFFANLPCWQKTKKQFINWTGESKHEHDDYPDTVALLVGSLSLSFAPQKPAFSAKGMIAAIEAQYEAQRVFTQPVERNTGWPDCGSDICC